MEWLNYHHLLHFWLVAREGSIQRASEILHVTPASVSVQIKQLQENLGVRLLKKQGRGLVLTEVGQQVAEYAQEIFATGNELVAMVKGRPIGRPLELRVGIRDVMPKLVAFRVLQPALKLSQTIRLVCREGELSQLVSDLAIHKLDIVLSDTALDPLYKVQAHSYKLGESRVVIVGTCSLVEQYRSNFPHSLTGAPMLIPTRSSMLRRQLERWFAERRIMPMICGEFDDGAMMKIAGRSGLGLLAVPEVILEEVKQIYALELLGPADGVIEQFYGVSVERKVKHPGVLAIRKSAAGQPHAEP